MAPNLLDRKVSHPSENPAGTSQITTEAHQLIRLPACREKQSAAAKQEGLKVVFVAATGR